MDEEALKKIVDGLFAFGENRLRQNPSLVWMVGFVEMARVQLDAVGVPALLAWLKQQGYVT